MNKKEKEIMLKIATAIPKMSEFDKGYFLGFAESKAQEKKEQKQTDQKERKEEK